MKLTCAGKSRKSGGATGRKTSRQEGIEGIDREKERRISPGREFEICSSWRRVSVGRAGTPGAPSVNLPLHAGTPETALRSPSLPLPASLVSIVTPDSSLYTLECTADARPFHDQTPSSHRRRLQAASLTDGSSGSGVTDATKRVMSHYITSPSALTTAGGKGSVPSGHTRVMKLMKSFCASLSVTYSYEYYYHTDQILPVQIYNLRDSFVLH